MLKVRVKGGLKKRVNQLVLNSGVLKHSMPIVGSLLLVHPDDIADVKKICKRNFIPIEIV